MKTIRLTKNTRRGDMKEGNVGPVIEKGVVRVQFDITVDRLRELDNLLKETPVNTRKELINNALSLLEWAVKERKSGRIIASLDENAKSYKELCMPILGC